MIGLRLTLYLDDRVLEEVELREVPRGTEVLKTVDNYKRMGASLDFSPHFSPEGRDAIISSYVPKIMSNESAVLEMSSFLYD